VEFLHVHWVANFMVWIREQRNRIVVLRVDANKRGFGTRVSITLLLKNGDSIVFEERSNSSSLIRVVDLCDESHGRQCIGCNRRILDAREVLAIRA